MTQRSMGWSVLGILGLLALVPAPAVTAQEVPAYQVVEVVSDLEVKETPGAKVPEYPQLSPLVPYAAKGMALLAETEPNDTTATANALAGSEAVVYGTIAPAVDVDYFSFTANAGDRVSAATMTSFSNGGSTDTEVSIIASDGTTVLEFDDDSGSFSTLSSAISGTVIPAAGTYYVFVDGASTTSTITPYHLHLRVLSGTPTGEVEPNNDTLTATPIGASGWMSGTITATTDPDFFSIALTAGDSVFIALDMDPDRDPANTNWNGRVGLGLFGDTGNQILIVNDGSTVKPHAEAFFITVKSAGTYYPYVDSAVATGLGANARYHLSVRVIPKQVQTDCTVIASSDVPKALGPDVGLVTTSVIAVPPTVTSSINDLNLLLDLDHALMADLDVTLTAPGGTVVPLFTDIGAAAVGGQASMDLGLDDNAAIPMGTYTAVTGMVNLPEQPGRLAGFNGQPAGGTWTLTLTDDANAASGGTLNAWSLEICGDQPPAYGLTLTKTVGLDPALCATSTTITVPPGATVYYCYTVINIGLNDLVTHDLVDDQLGTLFTGFPYSLAPGASVNFVAPPVVVNASVTNTATWTGHGVTGGQASDSASATVTVPTHCPAGFEDVTLAFSDFTGAFPPAGWTVANTSVGCTPPGVPEWTTTNPGLRANLTGGSGLFAIADSDRCGSGSTLDTTLTTPAFDLTSLTDPRVYFQTDYNDLSTGGTNDQALLEVSTDGGGTWAAALTWDEDHRGPLFVEQAISGAGLNGVQVRWHYAQGTYDWWWQVDGAMVTACQEAAQPSISLVKTVGTTPGVCAATTSISVAAGTTVYYCYEVTNTGGVTLNLHDLSDDVLGSLATGLSYALTPGSSVNTVTAGLSISSVVNSTTTNTGTWTAYNTGGPSVQATAQATVTVVTPPNIDVSPLSLASTQPGNVTTQQPLTIANTGGSDLTWTITEEPLAVAPPVAQPPIETLNPEPNIEAELTGLDFATPALTVRDPAAAARARSMLQVTGLLLVPDTTNDRVMAFDPITGNLVDADFIPADPTHLSTPKSAILSASGDSVLVADQIDDVVQEYDLDGNYVGVFAPAGGANPAILDNILGIDLRLNNNLLVPVDSGTNQDSVAEFDTAGAYLGNFIAIGAGGLDGGFDVFPLGTDWLVTSINSDNVLRYDSTGASLGVFAPGVSFGEQINGAGNGNVLVANFSTPNTGVMEFTPAGALVGVYSVVTGNRGVYELPNGNILTSNGTGLHEIDRLGNLVSTKFAGTGAQYIEFAAPGGGCDSPADVPWLSEVPTNGTTSAGGSTPVQVTFDSTGLADGTYSANLCVASNDPDPGPGNGTDLVVVPVTLNVESLVPAISLVKTVGTTPGVCAATTTITVAPGTTVYYCYEVTNTGNVTLNLHTLVDDQLGTLVTGLAYALTPGSSVNTVTAGLSISAVITAPTTNVGTWTAYNAGPVDQVIATATATVNLTDPDITVNPTSLMSAQLTNTVVTLPLNLGNVGGSDLTWTLEEEPVDFPQMPVTAGPGDAAVAEERYDEQPPATVPDEFPEAVPWSGPELVLFDNGPLVTHPGGGAGGADASALQTNLGMNTLGAGAQVAAGNRVADDFTVTDPSGWDLDTITFFTYQTGSTTTSTINALNVRIWNGPPNDPASVVVWGDTTTNILTSTTWSNIYRTTDTTLTTTNRPIMTAVGAVNTVLPAGTYWVDYQIGGTLASGPWIPPVTILGQTTTGNCLQYTSTGWAALTDSGTLTPQGVPFIVEGQPAICGNLADVPWLSASPTAGTIAAAGSQQVDVSFDSTGLALGLYQATLCVFSNDPDEPVVPVPVTMEVVIPVELQSFSVE